MNSGLKNFLIKTERRIEPIIQDLLSKKIGERHQKEILYPIKAGGKRLRPALLILSSDAFGCKKEEIIYAAAAVEIMHNYSLIIDDIIDSGEMRRGSPTTWKKWGKSVAECVGVHYASAIFDGALQSPEPIKTASVLVETLQILTEGELIDILQERNGREEEPFVAKKRYEDIKLEDCLEMSIKKTAKLFETCCLLGGTYAGASENEKKALKKYGLNLGISFQIRDDILDIFGEEKKFGKKIGKDIEERKGGNVVIFFVLDELKEENDLKKIMLKKEITKKDLQKAIQIIEKTDAKKRAIELSEKYSNEAREALEKIPEGQEKEIMKELLFFIIQRRK